jgi:GTP-binding protein
MALKLAIVGRPNVGKSTLFNRLAGKKLAIVDDLPGVTRDRKFATGNIGDLDLDIIDTAGFEDATDESLEARMRLQTEQAIADCDVALFIIDAREGVVPQDEIFGDLLRRSGKPVILAANKAEGRQGDFGLLDAYRLGFGEPVPLSAEHGEGMVELYNAVNDQAMLLELDDESERGDAPVRIAIVGRPNAGKSTLINALVGEERLLTGPEAGITRDSIAVEWTWDGRRIRLVDTAGLRRKARIDGRLEKLSTQDTIRAITFAEIIILVMDASHPFETQDLQIADLAEREGRGVVYVLAKWDTVEDPQSTLAEFRELAENSLPQLRGTPLVTVSAQTGRGLDRLMPAVLKVHKDWTTKVKTRDLNDWLQLAMQRHPPPSVNGKRIKPKYMAQTKARPPTFVLFSTRVDQMPESYRRYLINSLRQSFDLPGVPLRITIKANRNPFVDGDAPIGNLGSKSVSKATAAKARPKTLSSKSAMKPSGSAGKALATGGKAKAKAGPKGVLGGRARANLAAGRPITARSRPSTHKR